MEKHDIFKSFTESLFDSILIIDDNRYTKKRKINEISYMTDDKDLIHEEVHYMDDDSFVDEEYVIKCRKPIRKWKVKNKLRI